VSTLLTDLRHAIAQFLSVLGNDRLPRRGLPVSYAVVVQL